MPEDGKEKEASELKEERKRLMAKWQRFSIAFCSYKMSKRRPELDEFDSLPTYFLLINKIQTASVDLSFSCLWSFMAIFWRLGICAWCGAHVLPKFWCHWSEPKGRLNSTMEFVSMRCTPISNCMHPNKNILAVAKNVSYTGNRSATFQLKFGAGHAFGPGCLG